jgi:hypothetical protein
MIVVALSKVTEIAGAPPKVTAAVDVPKLVPEMVTGVPPWLEPELGVTSPIVGPPGEGVEVVPFPAGVPEPGCCGCMDEVSVVVVVCGGAGVKGQLAFCPSGLVSVNV